MQEFPLSQDEVNEMVLERQDKDLMQMKVDYTPPQQLDLFFTDLGIFTASGITDELT